MYARIRSWGYILINTQTKVLKILKGHEDVMHLHLLMNQKGIILDAMVGMVWIWLRTQKLGGVAWYW